MWCFFPVGLVLATQTWGLCAPGMSNLCALNNCICKSLHLRIFQLSLWIFVVCRAPVPSHHLVFLDVQSRTCREHFFNSGVVTVEVTLQMVHQLLGSIWQHPGFAFNNLSVVKICNCFGVGTYSVQHPVFYFLFLMDWNLLFLIMFALAEQRRPWTKAWCSVHPWTSPESFRVIRIISTWQ